MAQRNKTKSTVYAQQADAQYLLESIWAETPKNIYLTINQRNIILNTKC